MCGMDIITLLKANIRKKKSTFISIMLLMVIIVAAMTSILSVQNNYDQALEDAFIYEIILIVIFVRPFTVVVSYFINLNDIPVIEVFYLFDFADI